METPVILSAVRTPIGKFQGGLSSFSAVDLGAKAVAEAIRRSGLEAKQVDEAILGNVVQAGLGQNPARQAAIGAGIPNEATAYTINQVCGSGLRSVALGLGYVVCRVRLEVARVWRVFRLRFLALRFSRLEAYDQSIHDLGGHDQLPAVGRGGRVWTASSWSKYSRYND